MRNVVKWTTSGDEMFKHEVHKMNEINLVTLQGDRGERKNSFF